MSGRRSNAKIAVTLWSTHQSLTIRPEWRPYVARPPPGEITLQRGRLPYTRGVLLLSCEARETLSEVSRCQRHAQRRRGHRENEGRIRRRQPRRPAESEQ